MIIISCSFSCHALLINNQDNLMNSLNHDCWKDLHYMVINVHVIPYLNSNKTEVVFLLSRKSLFLKRFKVVVITQHLLVVFCYMFHNTSQKNPI